MRACLHEGSPPRYYQRKGIPRGTIRGERRPMEAPLPRERARARAIGSTRTQARQAEWTRERGGALDPRRKDSFARTLPAGRLPALPGRRREMAAPGRRLRGRVPEPRPRGRAPAP
jgi:hypothetical protein